MAGSCAQAFSMPRAPGPACGCGRLRPAAQCRMRLGCSVTASSATSTGTARMDGRCRRTFAVAMPGAPTTGLWSSMSSRSRSKPWDWHEPAPESGWPTSLTTSGDRCSYRAASPPDAASWDLVCPNRRIQDQKAARTRKFTPASPHSSSQTPISTHDNF